MTITQVLSVEPNYECFEYLPTRFMWDFILTGPAFDVLSHSLPSLSKMVLGLDEFTGYSPSWDQAYKKATGRTARYLHTPRSCADITEIVCALTRFENLSHLTLHYELREDQVALMHPTPGCEAVRELFESIQIRKRGRSLVQLDVVFRTHAPAVFGWGKRSWRINPSTVSVTMTVVNANTSSQNGKQPQYTCTCDNPLYGKLIERRKRIERLYGKPAWTYRLGSTQWKLLQDKYRTSPWNIVMDSVTWLALLPSNFVFEEGKRVRYEPSLANMEMSCRKDSLTLRTLFKDKLFRKRIPY